MNNLMHVKEAVKRNYYENLIKTNSKNSSQTWSAIRKIIDCKHSSNKLKLPSTISTENQFYKTDSKLFLDKLCDYFATIGASLSKNIASRNKSSFKIHSKCCLHSFVFHEITEHDVSDCINNIKINSAHGIDEIPSKFVKMSNCILSPVLAKLFNKCIKLETFPDSFKMAYVVPIAKVSSPKSLDDFRPISLLCVFPKVFEKISLYVYSHYMSTTCPMFPILKLHCLQMIPTYIFLIITSKLCNLW